MREFGSEFEGILTPDNYFVNQGRLFTNCEFTRSGREAIRLIAVSIQDQLKLKKGVVLLPSYICPSMVLPFADDTWIIHYYTLNRDLTINKQELEDKIKFYKPTCILIANYFGRVLDTSIWSSVKGINPEIRLIYDVTHSLLTLPKQYNEHIDYYVASLRKWVGISDGGVVLSNNFVKSTCILQNENTEFVALREVSLDTKNAYLVTPDSALKTVIKGNNRKAEDSLNAEQIYKMSANSLHKLNSLNVSHIHKKRNSNFLHLVDLIKNKQGIRLLLDVNQEDTSDISFMLPILVEDRDNVQFFFSENGLYTQIIWRIYGEANQCQNSVFISNRILCIPIDQRYNFWDIEDIARIIKSAKL